MSDEDLPSFRGERAAMAVAIFNSIRVEFRPQNALVAGLDAARMQALAIRRQRAATGQNIPMPVLRTIAEMGVGKTIGAETLVTMHKPTDSVDTRRPVLIATIDTTGLQISVPQAILRALGKPNWSYASKPAIAWERAFKAMREHDVQIVIFDEMNRASRRPSMGEVIGGDLLDMLVIGQAAVAFLGTPDANKVFNRVPALKDRMRSPVILKALAWYDNDDEKNAFIDFLQKLGEAMHSRGIVSAPADLHNEDTAHLLWEVCRGRLRPLCLLLEEAVSQIHHDNIHLVITHEVLAQAVENHSIENEIITYNPFKGERPS
jgi:hypothetical protein